MSTVLARALGMMELLSGVPGGMPLGEIADRLKIPASAAHRLANELIELGYFRRSSDVGDYALSMKMTSLALTYLSEIDLVEQAKPSVDRIARGSKALARLGIVDDKRLIWVLKSQGSTSNIRYDPPMHHEVQLSCSASGHAWLSLLSDEKALELVFRQGLKFEGFGPNAPRTVEEVLELIRTARDNGYARVTDSYEDGVSAIAVPIVNPRLRQVTGVLSVAGLTMQMTDEKIHDILPLLQEEAGSLSEARLDYAKYLLPTNRERIVS